MKLRSPCAVCRRLRHGRLPGFTTVPATAAHECVERQITGLGAKIGALQLASFGYYALPQSDGLLDHNQGPVDPRGNSSRDTALLASQALNALAVSAYGWDPRDILARERLGLVEFVGGQPDDETKRADES